MEAIHELHMPLNDPTVALIISRLDRQDEQLNRILDQATATNGRLRSVEREQERTRGALEERRRVNTRREWIIGTCIAVVSVAVSVCSTIFFT